MLILISITLTNYNLYAQMGKCKGKYLGNVIDGTTNSGADYKYNTYWNQATAENGCKWGSVESSQGSYNFSTCDVAYNWAKSNSGLFKYHNFAWGSQTPGYVSSASTATITQAVENYIAAVANHYNPMGGIALIDVFNEPVHTALPGNYKAALTAGYQAANPGGTNEYGWIIWVFQLARKYFPNAKLLLNEYSIENDPNGALVTYAAMANAVLNAPNLTDGSKNLIDGLGLQCHAFSINASTGFTASELQSSLDKLYSLTGLPMHITEMDLDANPNETTQSNQYQALFPVAWNHPHVAGMTLWGYVQGFTWRNGNGTAGPNGTDSGIMYASTYSANPGGERPALTWIKNYMASQPNLSGCPLPGTEGPGWGTTTTTTSPTVSITTPANNATYTAPASVTIAASASETGGTISSVQFYNGTTLLGTSTTSPYGFSWSNVAAGTYSITAKATDSNGNSTTSTAVSITVNAPANKPPTVSITAPANNASYTAPASVTITATAADADGTVSSVQFYNGTTLLGTSTTAPYSFTWTNVAAGTYSITAKATDNSGAVTTSAAVSITVNPTVVQGPVISITSPANNASFTSPASITISVNATDATGTVTFVKFLNGTTVIGVDSTAPYSFVWTNVAAGTYSITASATDNNVAAATSAAVTVKVNAPAPPSISITSPANNASYTAPASVTITASATDASSTITSVQFYNGTTLLGTSTTAPYSFAWTNVAAGTYSVTAKLTDSNGATATSSAVTVKVNAPAPPSISITSPANNANFTAPASIAITTSATDASGTITSVQFYNGTTLLGTSTTAPYSFTWTNVAAGTYAITAKVTDSNGNSATSAAVDITVSPVSTADITGPSCGAVNSNISFAVNPSHRTNATSYSWYFQGYTQSITPTVGAAYDITISTGQYFTGGEVCVGIQYSAAPYYASYCLKVAECSAAARLASVSVAPATLSAAPNPFTADFNLSVPEPVAHIAIINSVGEQVFSQDYGNVSGSIDLGSSLNSGLYVVTITYSSGTIETTRVVKMN